MGIDNEGELIYGCKLKKYRFPRWDRTDDSTAYDTICEQFNEQHAPVRMRAYAFHDAAEQHEFPVYLAIELDDGIESQYEYKLSPRSVGVELLLAQLQDWRKHERLIRKAAQELGEEPDDVAIGVHAVPHVY